MQSLRYSIGDYLISDSCLSANVCQESRRRGILFESPQRPNFWTLFFASSGHCPEMLSGAPIVSTQGRINISFWTEYIQVNTSKGTKTTKNTLYPSCVQRIWTKVRARTLPKRELPPVTHTHTHTHTHILHKIRGQVFQLLQHLKVSKSKSQTESVEKWTSISWARAGIWDEGLTIVFAKLRLSKGHKKQKHSQAAKSGAGGQNPFSAGGAFKFMVINEQLWTSSGWNGTNACLCQLWPAILSAARHTEYRTLRACTISLLNLNVKFTVDGLWISRWKKSQSQSVNQLKRGSERDKIKESRPFLTTKRVFNQRVKQKFCFATTLPDTEIYNCWNSLQWSLPFRRFGATIIGSINVAEIPRWWSRSGHLGAALSLNCPHFGMYGMCGM